MSQRAHLDVGGLQQQVAQWFIAGRRQHRVLDVVHLQAQRAKVIGLVLVSVPFGLQKIPGGWVLFYQTLYSSFIFGQAFGETCGPLAD